MSSITLIETLIMKTLTIILSLSLASVALAEEPAELVKLRKTWENSQAEAKKKAEEIYRSKNTKANKLYYEELHEMKDNFMEAKNLKAAVAVDAEIKKLIAQHGKEEFEVQLMTEKKESMLKVKKLEKYLTGKVWSSGPHDTDNKVEFFDNGTFLVKEKDWGGRFAVIGPKSITLKWGQNIFINCIMSEDLLSFHELNGMKKTWQFIGKSQP